MSTAERIAREFHSAYENLAPNYGYETQEATRVPWADLPETNRQLMIATVQYLLNLGVIAPSN